MFVCLTNSSFVKSIFHVGLSSGELKDSWFEEIMVRWSSFLADFKSLRQMWHADHRQTVAWININSNLKDRSATDAFSRYGRISRSCPFSLIFTTFTKFGCNLSYWKTIFLFTSQIYSNLPLALSLIVFTVTRLMVAVGWNSL